MQPKPRVLARPGLKCKHVTSDRSEARFPEPAQDFFRGLDSHRGRRVCSGHYFDFSGREGIVGHSVTASNKKDVAGAEDYFLTLSRGEKMREGD